MQSGDRPFLHLVIASEFTAAPSSEIGSGVDTHQLTFQHERSVQIAAMSDIEDDEGSRSRLSAVRAYFAEEVTESWTDAILILSCFVTGLLDSAIFNVWSCFVSMQTGQWS